MKLWLKIFFGIIGIIFFLFVVNIFFSYKVAENSRIQEIKTSELLFVKSLATRFFRDIAKKKNVNLVGAIFEEKRLREEKIEYILVFDKQGYLLAYTYLDAMPKQLLKLNHVFGAKDEYKIKRINNKEVSVYDVAVPVREGIAQVGTIHAGIKIGYVRKIAKATSGALSIIMVIFVAIGVLFALFMSKNMVKSLNELMKATMEVRKGNLGVKIKVSSRDEIGSLGAAFNSMIGDLNRYQLELISAKDNANLIINNMLDMLVVIDAEDKIVTNNNATSELLGYKEDELMGKPVASIIAYEDAALFRKVGIKSLIEKGILKDYSMIFKTKTGEEIPVSFSGSALIGKAGELTGVVGVAKDMRRINHLMRQEEEAEIAKAEANVERRKAKELEAAYKQLQELQDTLIQSEKFNSIGRLASGVAHEVKNPLGIIMQSAEYLEGKLLPAEKNAPEALRMILDNIKRADNIIRVLLDFSRVSKLEKKPENINSILENSLVLIQHRVTLENIKIIRELGKDLPDVLVDQGKLEQVFINIFLNAIQAMPGGGSLFIRTFSVKLNETRDGVGLRVEDYFKPGEMALVVAIEDTGAGISAENLNKIFDPFFTTKEPGKGTGLGLSVAKNILIMHKGLIEIKSQAGKGAKVIITLKIPEGGRNG
ncbi:MAG: ATP-binding protein [Candidatus Omnitrophota bacterium]